MLEACAEYKSFRIARPLRAKGASTACLHKNRKKPVDTTGFVSGNVKLHSAGDLTAAQAASADIDMLGRTVHNGLDALHIRLPGTVRASVRMADLYAKGYILITKLTFCHKLKHLLACVLQSTYRQLIYNNRMRTGLQVNFSSNLSFLKPFSPLWILRPDACKITCQIQAKWLIY